MAATLQEQIQALKSRRGWEMVGESLVIAVDMLEELWKTSAPRTSHVLMPFIPIRLATIVEVGARDCFRQLVDANQSYALAAERALKSIKFDHQLVLGLLGKKLTLGDVAAKVISTNDAGQILAAFETLEPDFSRKLRTVHTRWTDDKSEWPLAPIIGDFEAMMGTLASMFEARHISAHELPDNPPFEDSDIARFLSATREFVDALSWLAVELTLGSVPRTQLAINEEAANTVSTLRTELAAALKKLRSVGTKPALLARSQLAWRYYAIAQARLRSDVVKGGTLYSSFYNSEMADRLRQRIELVNEMASEEH